MPWRYIAQRAVTGEFLEWDLPLRRDECSWELSGPGALRATLSPDVGNLRAPDGRLLLEEWGTLVYAEADGVLRWGGIVVASGFNGPEWAVEAAGFSTYLAGMPYLGEFRGIGVDPYDVVREVWRHAQAYPDGNLGVTVAEGTSPGRLGTAEEPYELAWWEARDCASEVDALARETPFDWREEHAWEGEDGIAHRIVLGHPRLGRRRHDLAFVQGENVVSVLTAESHGDDFANEVVGIGAGEGRSTLHRVTAVRDGRLRRPAVWTDKAVTRTPAMDAEIARELHRRHLTLEFAEVEVADHPHARLGSWALGDDVLIRADVPWLGEVAVWHRIVGWTLTADDRATLTLRRSDSFTA